MQKGVKWIIELRSLRLMANRPAFVPVQLISAMIVGFGNAHAPRVQLFVITGIKYWDRL